MLKFLLADSLYKKSYGHFPRQREFHTVGVTHTYNARLSASEFEK